MMRRAALGSAALAAALAARLAAADLPVVLTIDGAAVTPLRLTAAGLAAMPRATVSWTVHGKTLSCAGPWLSDVLARAGVAAGDNVRGAELTRVVVATGADGYRAAFTIGELDHKLGNAPAIVADQCDSKALPDADGPLRLVASEDQRGARSVRQLVRLAIVQLATPNR